MGTLDTSDKSPLTPGGGFSLTGDADFNLNAPCGLMAPHPASTAGAPPSGRAARRLDRALRVVDGGPRPFYRAAILSIAVTSMLAIAVAALTRPPGSLPGSQRHVIAGALVTLDLSVVLGLASLVSAGRVRPPAWLDRSIAPRERAAIWLALAAWLPLMLVVVYYRAEATFPPPARYIYSPYDDKRWITSAYLLGALAPVIWVTAAARVLAVGRGRPPSWRAWFTGLFPRTRAADLDARADRYQTGTEGG